MGAVTQDEDEFEFLNSNLWIKYTQSQYRTLDEIKYRLSQTGTLTKNWNETEKKIIKFRKAGAIPIFLHSIDKKFWFYPADCIYEKAHHIEKKGMELYQRIIGHQSFAKDFIVDAAIEEAITSAIYEGANSTRAKAKELIELNKTPKNKDEWMLLNNFKAMMWIKDHQEREVTLDVIKEVHAVVTKNTLSEDDVNFSGKFRNDRVFVWSGSDIKHEGISHEKVEVALKEAIEVTTKHMRYFPPLLKGMLLHYLIAYIHPFFDGNGRTARTLFYFKSMRNNLKFVELLSVSAYLKNHGKQYEKSFEKVKESEMDLTYFIDFNLDALKTALEKVSEKIEFLVKIANLKKTYELTDQQIGLLQRVALHKFRKYDIEKYAESIGKSREIARQELKQLAELKLLEEAKEGKKFVYTINSTNLEKEVARLP
jgi:Fic family protein